MLAREDKGLAVPAVEGERRAGQIAAREMGERGAPLRAAGGVPELVTSETWGGERSDVSSSSGASKGVVAVPEFE